MEFRLLGPLEVSIGDEPIELGPPKQRALLALLLVHANEVVPREVVVDALCNERPPATAQNALQVYVHGLRGVLGRKRIALRGAGYSGPGRRRRARPRALRTTPRAGRGGADDGRPRRAR